MPNQDLVITIPAADRPRPGEIAEYTHEDGLYLVLVENTGAPTEDIVEPDEAEQERADRPLISYTVVDVVGATRTHAAIVRHHERRSVVNRWTLCSVTNSRRVRGRRRDQDLGAVTCSQCRSRLQALGEL